MDIDEFTKKLDMVVPEFEKEFKARVAERTPVLTGALQAGWVWDRSEKIHVFTNLMTYAGYVEFGTPTHSPVGMVGTTVLESNEIMKIAVARAGL